MNNIIQFRDSGLKKALAEKGRVSEIARRDLVRYQNLLKWAFRGLNFFEKNEIMLLIDTMNGSMSGDFDIDPATLLWANVADSCDFGLDNKWDIDGSALIKKLQSLSRIEAAALLDAIERFWYEPDSYQIEDMEEKLKAIGFVFEEGIQKRHRTIKSEPKRKLLPLTHAPEDVRAKIARYLPPDWEAWDSIHAWVGEDTVFFVGKKDGKTVQIFISGKSGNAVEDVVAEGKKQGSRTFYVLKEAEC